MLINEPPAAITDNLRILGIGAYPLYLVQSDGEAALFEGGIGAVGPLVLEQLDAEGFDRTSIGQLIVTHAHPDHVMAVATLRAGLPELTVAGSAVAQATLANEKAVGFFAKMDAGLAEGLIGLGLIDKRYRPEPPTELQIPVDRVLAEGDKVAVGSLSFDVLPTPGHSDCSLSFFEPTVGILIAADAVPYYLPESGYFWPNYFGSYEAYLASIRRLEKLKAEVLCLGHHGAVTGAEAVASLLADSAEATEAYHRRIIDAIKAGQSPRELGEELGGEIHEKMPVFPLDFFQKNCGLLAKLSMKHEGAVQW